MKSKKIIVIAKGVWAFCSYLFVPQRGGKRTVNDEATEENINTAHFRPP